MNCIKRMKNSIVEFQDYKAIIDCIVLLMLYVVIALWLVFRVDLSWPVKYLQKAGVQMAPALVEALDGRHILMLPLVILQIMALKFGPVIGTVTGVGIALTDYFLLSKGEVSSSYIVLVLIGQVVYSAGLYQKTIHFTRMLICNLIVIVGIKFPIYMLETYAGAKSLSVYVVVPELVISIFEVFVFSVFAYMLVSTMKLLTKREWAKEQKETKDSRKQSYILDLGQRFKNSASELKRVDTLVVCALMLALGTILGMLFSFKINDSKVVGISVIAPQLVSALYGPVVGGIVGIAGDLLDCIIKPQGPFFPGYTLNAFLGQMIYGIVLYKRDLTFKRIVFSKLMVALLVNIPLGSLWQSILVGNAALNVIVLEKAIQQAIQIPVLGLLFYMFVSALKNAKIYQQIEKR